MVRLVSIEHRDESRRTVVDHVCELCESLLHNLTGLGRLLDPSVRRLEEDSASTHNAAL